jgi:hypothetical protein
MSAGLARLVHDVAKYVARTARNLGAGPIPAPLLPMLAKDLYALDGHDRASSVFEARAREVHGHEDTLAFVRARFAEIDALESAVRAGDEGAARRAAALAREIEDALRALLREEDEAP